MSSKIFAKYLMTLTFVIYAALIGLLSGCSDGNSPPAAEKPSVSVVTVKPRSQSLTTELAGRTKAYMVAEIRPQVSGIVQQRLFVEGAEIKAGQPLYQLDSATYQAALAESQATLAKSRATLKSAQATAKRDVQLAKIDAISQQDKEDAEASLLTAAAEVKVAEAD
ncbi:biotin/lipoyl-binding protein, partial [Pseudomonas syringae]